MLHRNIDGAFHKIFKKLKEQDSDGFKGSIGHWLFWRIGSSFKSIFAKARYQHERMYKLEERCWVTLRYLASGKSFRSLEYKSQISKRAICDIVYEVAFAITQALGK